MADTRRVDLPSSILNPWGPGNPSGASGVLTNVPRPTAKSSVDPASVMTQGGAVDTVVMRLVQRSEGAPRTAELVAKRLAEVYGPFTASNSQQNRDAIIANLAWIAGTAIAYNDARASGDDSRTQSPNDTVSRRSGICRDTHTAMAAILSSLAHARRAGGGWVPGAPQNDVVRVIGYANARENHVYMVYVDPTSGRWNALEYGKTYNMQAATDIEAFAALPNYIASYSRYVLNGWNGRPTIGGRDFSEQSRAREFFRDDVGIGQPGEVRVAAGPSEIKAAGFITRNVALVGAFDPQSGGMGGKANYHNDFATKRVSGYVHATGGAYTQAFLASSALGRAANERQKTQQTVIGGEVDAVVVGTRPIADDHLHLRYGGDATLLLGLPVTSGAGGHEVKPKQYSDAELGVAVGLGGQEKLSTNWRADWAMQYRQRADLLALQGNIQKTGARRLSATLWNDAGTLSSAGAVSYQDGDGTRLRLEIGADRTAASSFASALSHGTQYVSLGAATAREAVSVAAIVRGTTDRAISDVGTAVSVKATDRLTLGLGGSLGLDARVSGSLMGSAGFRF